MHIEQLLILAGGMATRLKPVTEKIPKSMIEVAGRPFIEHQLELVKRNGIRRILICASHLGEMIMEHVGNGSRFGVDVDYSLDGDKLLGTGGAVKNSLDKLDESFFVLYGDSYLNTDFEVINEYFFRQNKPSLMTVYRNMGNWDSSNVVFARGEILAYDKRNKTPDMQHIDYGLGILSHVCFDEFRERDVFDLAEVYSLMLLKKQLAGFEVHERFYEIGSFEGLKETGEYISGLKK